MKKYSIIIPAYNEEGAIGKLLEEALHLFPKDKFEIIVVNDCSKDKTLAQASLYPVKVISNVQNTGYGYSLKQGISVAAHEHIIIIDADGSYPLSSIPILLAEYEKGFDMIVGARHGKYYRGSFVKRIGRLCFRVLSEFTTGRKIPDINSGCRVFRKDLALRFFHTLSSGFSFTTTITLAFMLNAYSVKYIPIEYHKRAGNSKVRYVRDILRSLQIIFEAIVFYNPIKVYILCVFAILISGVIGGVITFFIPIIGVMVFLTFTSMVGMMGLGFVVVFLKFMHSARDGSKDKA